MKNLKSMAFGLIIFLFTAGLTLSACSGGQQSGEATEAEEVEQEAPASEEHPSDDAAEESEHPSDSTASEAGEHPADS